MYNLDANVVVSMAWRSIWESISNWAKERVDNYELKEYKP